MPKSTLLQENIGRLVDGISPSAVAHAARCKRLTEYMLSCPGSRKIFHKRMYTNELVLAVSYHDFGKAFVLPNCTNARYCRTSEEIDTYREHIAKAEDYIKENSELYATAINSFDRYIFECSTMHHEAFDGSGFPQGMSGSYIPMTARLCAAVDFIDNVLAFDFTDGVHIEKVEEELTRASGTLLDPDICELVLKHMNSFEKLCNDMYDIFKNTPEAVSRLILRYAKQYTASEYKIIGCDVVASMWDADFGEVKAEVFRAVADKSEAAQKLDKLIRQRTFRQAEQMIADGIDFGRITVFESVKSLERKDYIDELRTLMEQYDVPPERLTVCVSEELLLSNMPGISEVLGEIRELGIRLSVDGFGELCKSFDVFEDFKFDEIRLSKVLLKRIEESKESFEVMVGMIVVARNLGIDVVCPEVNSLDDEQAYIGMGVNILSGMLYGGAYDEADVADAFGKVTGAANES